MRADLLSRSAAELASLRQQGVELAAVEIPRVFGRGSAITRAEGMVETARGTAVRTRELLREAGFGPAADAMQGALRTLDDAELTGRRLFSTGHGLQSAVASATGRIEVELAALVRRALATPAAAASDESMQQLARIARLDEDGKILRMAGQVERPAELNALVGAADDVAGARRLHARWQREAADAARVRDEVHELVSRDRTRLDEGSVDRLVALVGADPDGLLLTGPRQVDHGMGFTSTLRSSLARPDDVAMARALDKYLPAWQVATLPPQAQARAARTILATQARDVSTHQWRQLQQLLDDRSARSALQDAVPGRDVREMAASAGGGLGMAAARRFHADWTVSQLDEAGRLELARAVFRRSPERLTEGEWAVVEALTRSDIAGPRRLSNVNELASIARTQAHEILEQPSTPWNANPYFSAWNEALDPSYLQRVDTAVDDVAAGRGTREALELLLIERDRLGSLLSGRSAQEQRTVAAALLSDSRVAPSRDVRDVLALTRTGLDDARGIHEDLEPLRRQTLELVDLNLERIAGTHRAGAVRGWSNHPDYAEIGRIRSNLDLIANASRSRQGGDVLETLRW